MSNAPATKGTTMLRHRTAAVVGTVALAAGVIAGAGGYAAVADGTNAAPVDTTSSAVSNASSRLGVGAIYQKANAGVVEITATSNASTQGDSPFPFGEQQGGTQQAQGSGFVYDSDGHIVTNYHVVQGATSLEVALADGSTYDATVVGTDPSSDLAVIKIDAPSDKLHPLALGDSSDVAVGDGVVAIGSPYGLEETVTSGIVSALGRTIQSTNGYSIPGTIQTDAAINHGNSGGPLFNLSGEVIGVNSQIESESGGNTGVGFAIPSNTVRSVADQLIAGHEVEHAYLGVRLEDTPGEIGAQVASVSGGSPAAKAGLRAGDVITAFDGDSVESPDALTAAVSAKSPGDEVTVTYTRDGDSRTAQVTLGTRPS
jgi:putative serine protease PepD